MYRDNFRNIHARACRGIHARFIIFKFPMKMEQFGPTETKVFHFHRISKTGGMEGVREPPEPKLDPPLYANAQPFLLHHT